MTKPESRPFAVGAKRTGFGHAGFQAAEGRALPRGHHRGATRTGLPPCQVRGTGPDAATSTLPDTPTPTSTRPCADEVACAGPTVPSASAVETTATPSSEMRVRMRPSVPRP